MNAYLFKLVIHTSQERNLWKTLIIEGKLLVFKEILIKSITTVSSPSIPLSLVCEAAGSVHSLVKPTVQSIQLPWSCHVESSKQISSLHFPQLQNSKTAQN